MNNRPVLAVSDGYLLLDGLTHYLYSLSSDGIINVQEKTSGKRYVIRVEEVEAVKDDSNYCGAV